MMTDHVSRRCAGLKDFRRQVTTSPCHRPHPRSTRPELTSDSCRSLMRVVSFITQPGLIRRILDHLVHRAEEASSATLAARPDLSVGQRPPSDGCPRTRTRWTKSFRAARCETKLFHFGRKNQPQLKR